MVDLNNVQSIERLIDKRTELLQKQINNLQKKVKALEDKPARFYNAGDIL